MEWKEWPMWVRVGIVLSVVEIILMAVGEYCFEGTRSYEGLHCIPLILPQFPVILLGGLEMSGYIRYPLFAICWFFIGAGMGWIVGKIKAKKKK